MKGLDEEQLARLKTLFRTWLHSLNLQPPGYQESETTYTRVVILPLVENFVRSLSKDTLFVRGDGGSPPLPLTMDELQFFPDLEIVSNSNRYIAVEVKILRNSNYTGSLSKALGQALIYRTLGVTESHVILLDQRFRKLRIHDPKLEDWLASMNNLGLHVHWFANSASGQFSCLNSFEKFASDHASNFPRP